MKISPKYYFEVFVTLLLLYFDISIGFFSRLNTRDKIVCFFVNFVIFIMAILIGFAFKKTILGVQDNIKNKFQNINSGKSSLLKYLPSFLFYGILIFLITSAIEFASFSFIERFSYITFGFPIPVYSFVVDRPLWGGLLLDTALYTSLIYFMGYILVRNET